MKKRLIAVGFIFSLVFALNGCYSDSPQPDCTAAEVPNSSFSESNDTSSADESEESTVKAELESITREETEYSKAIAETATTTVSKKTEIPKSEDTEKQDKPESKPKPTKPVNENGDKKPNGEQPKDDVPEISEKDKATADDSQAIANKVLLYINGYRNKAATNISGLNRYAQYRSVQLVSNFAHDTADQRTAAEAVQYCGHTVSFICKGSHAYTQEKCPNCGESVTFPPIMFRRAT